MQDQQQSRRSSLGLIAVISALVLGAGGMMAWWAKHSLIDGNSPQPVITNTPKENPHVTQQPSNEERVTIYWLNDTANKIDVVPSEVTIEKSDRPSQVLEGAMEHLLAGPNDQAYATTIPEGTKLLGISMENDGVHVNLSKEFTTGGGSTSMTGRLAQILYTASSLNPKEKVWIDIEGEPLEFLGGEGLIIEQPMNREDFKQNFSL